MSFDLTIRCFFLFGVAVVDAEDEELDVELWLVDVEENTSFSITVGRPPYSCAEGRSSHFCAEGRSSQESIEMGCATESGLG